MGMPEGTCCFFQDGRLVSRNNALLAGIACHGYVRVLGGKGGFGSMLRAIGAQIEKTTSREACRDLSGRRIRDINNEKKLKDWVSKQADFERERVEREERRREKRRKYLDIAGSSKMVDPEYDSQYANIMDNSQRAMAEGFSKLQGNDGRPINRKRKAASDVGCAGQWSVADGVNVYDLSDSCSDPGQSDEAVAECPCLGDTDSEKTCPIPALVPCAATTSSAARGSDNRVRSGFWALTPTSVTDDIDFRGIAVSDGDCGDNRLAGLDVGVLACSTRGDTVILPDIPFHGPAVMGGSDTVLVSTERCVPSTGEDQDCITCHGNQLLNLEHFCTAEDLEYLGLEQLKTDLTRRGMKCGGTLKERADRLYCVKGMSLDEIPVKLLAKGSGRGKCNSR